MGRYRLIEAVGSGAFGTVWRAVDERLDREVAVKAIPLSMGGERVEREIRATARLAHPGVVTIHEASADETHAYLISEFVRGTTLGELYVNGRCSDRDVARIGAALAAALDHAHAQGVIHRDIKPGNILIPDAPRSEAGIVKLADFGIASLAGDDALTRTGDVIGTLAYMSPEQAAGRPVGVESDLWSLAIVVHEGLSGFNPVRGRTPADTARRLAEADIPSLEESREDLSEDLIDAIDRALLADPAERGSISELGEALAAATSMLEDEPGTVAPAVRRSERTFRVSRTASKSRRVPLDPIRQEPEATVRVPLDPFAEGPGSTPGHSPAARSLGGWVGRAVGALAAGLLSLMWVYELAPASTRPERWIIAASVCAAVALLPRLGWLAAALASAVAMSVSGRPGAAIVLLAALLPCVPLMWRRPAWWSLPSLAPLLGAPGFAGAWPGVASLVEGIPMRAAAGAIGAWQVGCAELLLGRTLLAGAPASAQPMAVWDGDPAAAVRDGLIPLLQGNLPKIALLWAVAAVALPFLVRGVSAVQDALAAGLWAVATGVGTGLAAGGFSRGALAGALAGAAFVVAFGPSVTRPAGSAAMGDRPPTIADRLSRRP
jgi:tRNA A-37 threonylcarbamoyl transferase component Bud32